ncbi:MAG: nucleotide pyrophosphohydrolase [Actinobacteria bacterium]|jgi:NTP pyrophosphatase (non-canonical NTP hydrolase)|nr:nucleotide pyrophosphohydrolase [Actinomycetota bacterium]
MERNIIQELTREIREFADARDWQKFHTPKNLAMAIAGEAGELAAEFQWLTPEESMENSLSRDQRKAIELEIADVQIYLLRLADVLNVDIPEVVREKIQINNDRF